MTILKILILIWNMVHKQLKSIYGWMERPQPMGVKSILHLLRKYTKILNTPRWSSSRIYVVWHQEYDHCCSRTECYFSYFLMRYIFREIPDAKRIYSKRQFPCVILVVLLILRCWKIEFRWVDFLVLAAVLKIPCSSPRNHVGAT